MRDYRGPVTSKRPVVLHHLGAYGLLLAMGAALMLSMSSESPTTDEPVHLTRGLSYFWGPDASLSYAHPPLGNAYAAVPIVLTEARQPVGSLRGYTQGRVEAVAKALLAPDHARHRRWLAQARTAVAALTLALGAYLYFFCSRLWGSTTALLSLCFFALHPTLVAHGRLDTTDLPATAAMFIAVGELVRYLLGGSAAHVAACAVFVGVALATKYTALMLIPYVPLLVLGTAWFRKGRYSTCSRFQALRSAALVLAGIGLTALLVVNAAYRFEHTGLTPARLLALPEPLNHVTRSYAGNMLERETLLGRLPATLPIPLPHTYLIGLASMRAHDRQGHPTTLFGRPYAHGNPAYFPVLLAIKSPTCLLLALALAAAHALQRGLRVSLGSLALASFSGLLLALAMRGSINIGVRHVLPMLPAMAALGGRAVARLLERPSLNRAGRLAVIGCGLAHASGMLWAFPDYLSDFNALVGGRVGGEQISIVGEEWGQDTARLGALLKAHKVKSIYYHTDNFTGPLELRRFGITVRDVRCGQVAPGGAWVAVNGRDLARHRQRCYPWTLNLPPVLRVGEHVLVYHMPAAEPTAERR